MTHIIACLGLVVSVASAGIAVYAVVVSRRTQKRSLEIEEARERDRLAGLRRASLSAQLVREEATPVQDRRDLLRIVNAGWVEARDVDVRIDGKPALENPVVVSGLEEIVQVGPQSHFQYRLAPNLQTETRLEVHVTWSDDSGEPGSYRTCLTL